MRVRIKLQGVHKLEAILTEGIVKQRLRKARKIGFSISIALLIFGAIIGYNSMENARYLLSDGVGLQVESVITDMSVEKKRKKGKIRDIHTIKYKFTSEDGRDIVGEIDTSPSFYSQFEAGDSITMVYDRNSPENHLRLELAHRQTSLFGVVTRSLIIFLVSIIFFELIRLLAKFKLYRKLNAQNA